MRGLRRPQRAGDQLQFRRHTYQRNLNFRGFREH